VATKHAVEKREPHAIKRLMRTEMEKRFKPLDGGVFVAYRGLNSEQIYDLRKKLHAKGAKLTVLKNAVAMRAFEKLGYDQAKVDKILQGPTGVVYSPNGTGMVGAAKALSEWKKANKPLEKVVEVKGGFFKGSILSEAEVKAYQDLPSREVLLGMVAGAFQAPIQGLANCFYQSIAKFAGAIAAVEDKKKKETK
jgi:large subunit ribosomal protein L10